MAFFLSSFTNKVDKKGRVSVPATFRAAVANDAFPGIVLSRPFDVPCIEGADMAYYEQLSDHIYAEYGPFNEEQAALTSAILASAVQLPFDPEGRIMLPAALREYAGITDAVTFVGIGKKFRLWAPATFEANQAVQFVKAAEIAPKMRPMRPGDAK